MESKSFKFFNVLQITLFFAFAIIALVSSLYWIISIFNIEFLFSIKTFIASNLHYFVIGIGFYAGNELSAFSFISPQIINAIILCFSLLFFIWTLIIAIRLINVKEYNEKFRGGVLAGNIIFSLILIYNAFLIATKQSISTNNTALIAFIVDALFVILTILNVSLNSVGKKSLNKDELADAEKLANANITNQGEFYQQPNPQVPQRPLPTRPVPPRPYQMNGQQNVSNPTQVTGQTTQRPIPPKPPVPPQRPTPPNNQ